MAAPQPAPSLAGPLEGLGPHIVIGRQKLAGLKYISPASRSRTGVAVSPSRVALRRCAVRCGTGGR